MAENDNSSRLPDLAGEIMANTATSARIRRLADFLDACEEELKSSDSQARYTVFQEIAFLLAAGICDEGLWQWLAEKASATDQKNRETMRIAILELVPQTPINWTHVFRVWDMWFNRQTRWAVGAAYTQCPKSARVHFRRYAMHRRRLGLPVPEISEEVWQAFVSRLSSESDRGSGC